MKLYYFNHIFNKNKNKKKEIIHKTLNDISEEIDCKEFYNIWYNCITSQIIVDCEIFQKNYLKCVNTSCQNIDKN